MKQLTKGIIAGFAATIILSILMIIKANMGIMPQFDAIHDISNALHTPGNIALGWIMHFILGSLVWGILFVWFSQIWPNVSSWLRGIVFGILAWLLMMLIFMPMAGHGFFAVELGNAVLVMSLVLHIIYGFVLGWIYELLNQTLPSKN